MSRSGYSDDYDDDYGVGALNRYRANVNRTIAGKRGQAFLREMASALDAMPIKELITDELVTETGAVCAIGSVAVARNLDVSNLDPHEPDDVARTFRISGVLTREIVYENDERGYNETPAQRWWRMRKWVADCIRDAEKSQ